MAAGPSEPAFAAVMTGEPAAAVPVPVAAAVPVAPGAAVALAVGGAPAAVPVGASAVAVGVDFPPPQATMPVASAITMMAAPSVRSVGIFTGKRPPGGAARPPRAPSGPAGRHSRLVIRRYAGP